MDQIQRIETSCEKENMQPVRKMTELLARSAFVPKACHFKVSPCVSFPVDPSVELTGVGLCSLQFNKPN